MLDILKVGDLQIVCVDGWTAFNVVLFVALVACKMWNLRLRCGWMQCKHSANWFGRVHLELQLVWLWVSSLATKTKNKNKRNKKMRSRSSHHVPSLDLDLDLQSRCHKHTMAYCCLVVLSPFFGCFVSFFWSADPLFTHPHWAALPLLCPSALDAKGPGKDRRAETHAARGAGEDSGDGGETQPHHGDRAAAKVLQRLQPEPGQAP